jgi:hypothetical protein
MDESLSHGAKRVMERAQEIAKSATGINRHHIQRALQDLSPEWSEIIDSHGRDTAYHISFPFPGLASNSDMVLFLAGTLRRHAEKEDGSVCDLAVALVGTSSLSLAIQKELIDAAVNAYGENASYDMESHIETFRKEFYEEGRKPSKPRGLGVRPTVRRRAVIAGFAVFPPLVGVTAWIGYETGFWTAWPERTLTNIADPRTYWAILAFLIVSWLADGLTDVMDQDSTEPPLNRWWVGQQILRATASVSISTFFTVVSINPSGWLSHTPVPLYLTAFLAVLGDTLIIVRKRVHEGLHKNRGRLFRVIALHFVVLIVMPAITARAASDSDLPLGSFTSIVGLLVVLTFREYYNRFAPTTVNKYAQQVDSQGKAKSLFLDTLYLQHLETLRPASREATIMRYGQPSESPPHEHDGSERSVTPKSSPGTDLHEAHVTPLIRILARRHNINLKLVQGTGIGGRIRRRDVLAAAAKTHRQRLQ